jgi:alanine dehydrogenase
MRVGVPKEIKVLENRVGLTPASVREFVAHGHTVLVEHDAGAGIGLGDDAYRAAGGRIAPDAGTVFADSEMIVQVKEPQAAECERLQAGQILFTYLHLAPDPAQAEGDREPRGERARHERHARSVARPRGGVEARARAPKLG